VGGYPIQVRLINADREVKKELTVGRVVFGSKDEIFYLGSATTADANALGQKFKENGFFTDRGASVMLSKGDGVTTMSFVVADGTWDQADKVAAFETIARGCAGAVGGLPIKVRLTNSNVIVKKEVTVN
jgi:DTW domain-containing protein YfiP